jgi:hypothetical protein
MREVESSNIAAIGYQAGDPNTDMGTLHIRFGNGVTYEYLDVPAFLAEEMFEAESIGKFVNISIRNQYEGTKLEEADAAR